MPIKVVINASDKKDKKYTAVFYEGDKRIKTTHFGAKGYSDYTIHKDNDRKERYINRHKAREDWNNFMSPGSLSRWILWNKKSLTASIADYKRRFKLV